MTSDMPFLRQQHFRQNSIICPSGLNTSYLFAENMFAQDGQFRNVHFHLYSPVSFASYQLPSTCEYVKQKTFFFISIWLKKVILIYYSFKPLQTLQSFFNYMLLLDKEKKKEKSDQLVQPSRGVLDEVSTLERMQRGRERSTLDRVGNIEKRTARREWKQYDERINEDRMV